MQKMDVIKMIDTKNILILNHHASIPKYNGGGRHHDLALELSHRNYNVHLVASTYMHATKEYAHDAPIVNETLNENYKFTMIKTKPAYKNTIERFLNYLDFKNKVNKLEFNDIDVVIASSVHPWAWIAGYKISQKYKAKFIVEVRDLWPLSLYEDINKLLRPILFSYLYRLEENYYKKADSIIVTAPDANKYITNKYNISNNKIEFIPHSINIKEFDKNLKIPVSKEINKLLSMYYSVVYTGSLSRSEGLENLIYLAERFRLNKDIMFFIIGSGPEKSSLENLKKEMNLKNIKFIERVPRENIPSILKCSDVLFTGLREREVFKYSISKNKFYDYMAAEKPVLFLSNVNNSAIEKANCGFVIKNHSIDEAEEKLKLLYHNSSLSNQLAKNGRIYLERNHLISQMTDKFISTFDM